MPNVSQAGTIMDGTSDGRTMVEAISRDYGQAVALQQGKAFAFHHVAVTPSAAADVFARVSNTSSMNLIITSIVAQGAAADNIDVQTTANYVSATSHTDRTAVNMKAGSSNLWTSFGAFESDVDITGDAGSVTHHRIRLAVADTDYHLDLAKNGNPIIVPPGYSLLLEAVTGTAALAFTIFGHLDVVPYVGG